MSKESAMAMATGTPPTALNAVVSQTQTTPSTTGEPLQSTPFSQHAKKEAELVRKQQEFKKEQETWGQERARLQDAKKQYDNYNELKKTDPVAALKVLGFSETDIFNYMANQQPVELTPEQRAVQAAEQAADAKIKAFEEAQTKKIKDAQVAEDKSLIDGYRSELVQTMQKDKDKFEYCSYYGREALDLAYETTLAVVKESGGNDVISAQEAMQMVEEYYEDKDKEMDRIKKRQSKIPAVAPPVPPARSRTLSGPAPQSEAPKPTITKTRTLHNGATSTLAATRLSNNESREQKRERLINALRG